MQESLGDGWARDVHPDDRDRVFLDYHYSLGRRQKFRLEYRLRYQSGPYRWIVDFGAPVFDRHQIFLGYVGGCIDVTMVKGSGLATPWREKYEAVLNADVSELVEKVGAAEIAIHDRLSD
jgi:PAS fold